MTDEHDEDLLEQLYWEFDAQRKKTGDERISFKGKMRFYADQIAPVAQKMKLYVAVLDEFPDYMVPTLVAHSVLGAHLKFTGFESYDRWISESFKKCVLRVNQKEFDKIAALPQGVHLGSERKTLDGKFACAVVCPLEGELPNVLKFAKLWAPRVS